MATAVALLASAPAKAAFIASAEGAHVAVATDHGEATRAALDTLRAGGNAVDAAIAAATTLGVVSPVSSGLGGGGFALVYTAQQKRAQIFDFRETAPAGLTSADMVLRAVQRLSPEGESKRGVSVGVPGEPAGLELLSRRFGRRTLAEDVAPAVAVAQRGFPLGRFMADRLSDLRPRITASPELAAAFYPGGVALGYKDRLTRPELARTLTRFGQEGSRLFYSGIVAVKAVEAVRAAGGALAPEDLAGYQVKEREPLVRTVDGRTIVTMPAPSGGGLMVQEVLGMYGTTPSSPLKAMGFGSSAYLHTLAEAMRGAIADRVRSIGDPDLDPQVGAAIERALDPKQLAGRRARIDPNKTHPASEFRTSEHGTSHIVVADADGNVVALTTSVNDAFGARIVAGDTGVLLNNQLDDFSAPQDIAGFGVIGLGPNRPRPNARPVSSMAPTLVLEGDKPILALGASGGPRIATAVTQAAVARLVFGLDPMACVSAPRVHVNGSSTDLYIDPEIAEDVRTALHGRGEGVKEDRFLIGAVQMVAWDRSGSAPRLLAASDPRKLGAAGAQ